MAAPTISCATMTSIPRITSTTKTRHPSTSSRTWSGTFLAARWVGRSCYPMFIMGRTGPSSFSTMRARARVRWQARTPACPARRRRRETSVSFATTLANSTARARGRSQAVSAQTPTANCGIPTPPSSTRTHNASRVNPHSEQQHRHVHEPRRRISATGRYGARKHDRSRREEADVVFPGSEL